MIYLRRSRALIAEHLAGRHRHFMPASLLQSQIDTLEEPGPDEDPLIIDIGPPAGRLADENHPAARRLRADPLMAPARLPSTQPS